ncbi:hypothetical protein [Microbulbifer sp. ZKSA002]|uniref:hypothetical protein n=1 Tax=Microbulbifer sp. ZKSA002 TaxID=3243388 RepID=UPI004039E3F5
MYKLIALLIFLYTSSVSASTVAVCLGEGYVVATNERFIDLKVAEGTQCKGSFRTMKAGAIHRVYFYGQSVKENPTEVYISKSGDYLKNRPVGYKFGFIYTISESEGTSKITWQIEPAE